MKTSPPQTTAAKGLPLADIITTGEVTASITLPKSEIRDFYQEARIIAAQPYETNWALYPEHRALVATSWMLSGPPGNDSIKDPTASDPPKAF